jgi:hypothetical protein
MLDDNILCFLKTRNKSETLKPINNENLLDLVEKVSENEQKLIRNCLYFYLVNLLKCVDVILNKIGEGGFGSVYLCFNKKGNCSILYALKCIKSINSADRERRFGYVSKLNSDYLVKYHEIFTFNNDLYVVMQYFKNGNLNDFMKRYQKANQKIGEFVYFYFF